MGEVPGDGRDGGFGAIATGIESIAAALQLFDLCEPAESGASIALDKLKQVLKQHVGETHDIDQVLRPLRSETGQTSMGDGQVDFLSYWQCMDSFFREISGGPGRLTEAAVQGETDTIRGMRRFRDGVLQLWQGGKDVIPSVQLKALLSEIRDASDDPSYWEEVMQAVPCEGGFGLSLSEVAEAVCVWLRDVVREEEEDDDDDDDEEQEAKSEVASMKGFSKGDGDNSPRFSLKSELRQAEKLGYQSETPPTSPQVPFRRSSTFAAGDRAALHRDSLGIGPSSEILRAQELTELMRRAVDESGDVPSQRAMQKLDLAHDSVARQLHQQELELIELRRSNETAEKRMKLMEEELGHAQESQHELADQTRNLEEYMRKASALELELEELRQHLADSQQEVQQLRNKVEEADQKVAEVKKRDWQLRDRIESLEENEANAEGQLKWMRSELDLRTSELKTANRDLVASRAENVKLTSSLKESKESSAKTEQDLQASRAREEELRLTASEAGKRASLAAEQTATAATLQKELLQVKEELQASKVIESTLRSQVEASEAAQKRASVALSQHDVAQDQHREELVKLQRADADLREQLNAIRQELEASQSREDALRTQLGKAEDEARKKVQAGEELQEQLTKLQEELAAKGELERRAKDQATNETLAGEKIVALENKVQLQQDQLKKLRAARDSIVASQQDPPMAVDDEDIISPRQMMSDRQCRFLSAQLRILLRHSQEERLPAAEQSTHFAELEQLLDTVQPGSEAVETRRKQSLQRVHEEGKRVFEEVSEKLYTLEVQKNDVDEEVGRLQALVADLENQLASVRRQRDELQRYSASASTGHPESTGPELVPGVAVGRSSKAFTATSVTSDTRSRASLDSPLQKPGTARTSSSDAVAFFGTGSRSPSELRSSPKANIGMKVLAPAFIMSDFDTGPLVKQKQERRKNLRQGQRHVRETVTANTVRASVQRRDTEEDEAFEPTWRRRPSQAVRKSQAGDPRASAQRFSAAKLAAQERRESLQKRIREMKQPDSECGTQ